MFPLNRGVDTAINKGPYQPPKFLQTLKLKSVLKGSKDKYQIIHPNIVEKPKRPMSCGGVRQKSIEKLSNSTFSGINALKQMKNNFVKENDQNSSFNNIKSLNIKPPTSTQVQNGRNNHSLNNSFNNQMNINVNNIMNPSININSNNNINNNSNLHIHHNNSFTDKENNDNLTVLNTGKVPKPRLPGDFSGKLFSRRNLTNQLAYNSMISKEREKKDVNRRDVINNHFKRPKTAQERPNSPEIMKMKRNEKEREKEKLVKERKRTDSDRRILSKISNNNLSIRGSSPHNRLFFR